MSESCECGGTGMLLIEDATFTSESGQVKKLQSFMRLCLCPAGYRRKKWLEMTRDERKSALAQAKRGDSRKNIEEVPF